VTSTPRAGEPQALQAAFDALGNGAPDRTEQLARQFLGPGPLRSAWLTALALALSQQRRAGEALPHYRELVALEREVPEHWSNLGNCLCELGEFKEALPALQTARRLGADDAGTHFGLANALLATGASNDAAAHIASARRLDPEDAEFRVLEARIELARDEVESAIRMLRAVLPLTLAPSLRTELGYALLQAGQFALAEQAFRAVLAGDAAAADAGIGLALTLERCNDVDAARAARALIDETQAIASDKRLAVKLHELDARLATRSNDHAAAQTHLTAMLAGESNDPSYSANLWFELGRSYDATKKVDEAMQAFARAHAERRRQVQLSQPQIGSAEDILAILDDPLPPRPWPRFVPHAGFDGRRDPVFLVGFPRSGTTLLEQLLDAHEALASFDEQPFLQRLVKAAVEAAGDYGTALTTMDATRVATLRRQYFADIAAAVPDLGSRRAVDKNPLNLIRLPLVEAVLPASSVLFALRHPCDVVLSCYMQSFRAPAFAHTFETLASTARMYDRVMSFWTRLTADLELPVHTVRYESLVDDVGGTGRALFDFLDLPWNDQLLAFTERAKARGAISTPSYAQVVQPVNKKAVGRWQRYLPWFEQGALQTLQPWIEHFGYA
jgi:tetratricopeptide (TPR) repeat protein